QKKLLRKAHARVRRHFEGTQLEKTEPAGRRLRRIELVDAELGAMRVACRVHEQVAQQSIDEPRRTVPVVGALRKLRKRDLELVERIVARFVDARMLAGRPDEQAAEQKRQRRMVLP